MATSRDIQEIISMISSDKVKIREDGVLLLSSWMEGERSVSFCRLLGKNTARLKTGEIPHAETWPFLLTMLTNCIALEISSSKRRPPKLALAKTVRKVIQLAEDAKFSGRTLLLLSVVKPLFNHIWDVIRDVPSFQSEYGIILRQLLSVKEYRLRMRKRVYCSLVLLYMNKIETALSAKNSIRSNTKDEIFRFIATLHSLLENPPGDFPDTLRDGLVKAFVVILSQVREEWKILCKLVECINTFLLQDGPNLGCQTKEIHNALQDFMIRFWLTTHDRALKNALVLYARIQLKLSRSFIDGSLLIEQLLDMLVKELDQSSSVVGAPWDDKGRTLANSQHGLMELAASVFYQTCVNVSKEPSTEKRLKREHSAGHLKEGLMKGKWSWYSVFYFLLHNYSSSLSNALLIYWFEGIYESFERSLQELSSVMPLHHSREKSFQSSFVTSNEGNLQVGGGWHIVWNCLIHWLPVFSNVASVADAALVLLGNIISYDLINAPIVPQELWDLRIFMHTPSAFSLYFIACYFSKKGCQGDLRDILHLRQNLLKGVLGSLKFKESFALNNQMVWLLPAAIFSLCAGCVPFPPSSKVSSMLHLYIKNHEAKEEFVMQEDHEEGSVLEELFECSVEVLAQIEPKSCVEVYQTLFHHNLRLPHQMRHLLIQEMENHFLLCATLDKDIQTMSLSDLVLFCALLSNCMYGSISTRIRDEKSSLINKMSQSLLELLEQSVSLVQENKNQLKLCGYLGFAKSLDSLCSTQTQSSFRSFTCSPLFSFWRNNEAIHDGINKSILQAIERLLLALSTVFEEVSNCTWKKESDEFIAPSPDDPQDSYDSEARFVDVDFDTDTDSKHSDIAVSGKNISWISSSPVRLKLAIISAISSFFTVLPDITWDILFDLMEREHNYMVWKNIFHCLCKNFTCSSIRHLLELVSAMNNMIETRMSLRHSCVTILASINCLLETLLPSNIAGKAENVENSFEGKISEQNLAPLGDLVNKVAEISLLDWVARVKLINCICCLVSLDPHVGQGMIERLLAMLQDTDYRVRLFLARRVGVLFQTWDGHHELFQDICSSFGIKLIISSKEKLVSASEVVAAGVQPRPIMETVIVTLAHLAYCSAKVELEAIFMMSTVAAINPCLRELVYALLDNLSKRLQYTNRAKYFEQLMGSILFCWVACGVSLAALVQIQELFVVKSEPQSFMQYCCPWLLPSLILSGKSKDLDWVSMVASQPLSVLVKKHFVSIFAVCMALHCSEKSNKDKGTAVLRSSILQIAEISEHEQDKLIKKHLVSIVSCLLSLGSSSSDPAIPYFPMGTIVLAVQTAVDGFLDMDDHPMATAVVDKIQLFRPDRVFMFLVEIHYQITSAVHPRHRCHQLSAVEVLINIIGHRAAVPSTSCYLFNLVGQFIGTKALQDQCCLILSTLLEVFKTIHTKDVTSVLGEQLQFLVSKLVECCIPSKDNDAFSTSQSSKVLSLLRQLTMDADESLYDYIRELEPFPELDCFQKIQTFHLELCKAYSPRDHFLKFVRRTCYLSHRLLRWSLQKLHKKLLTGEIIQYKKTAEEFNSWCCEPEMVSAVWMLVGMCGSGDANDIRELVADFVSKVGIGDPHCVVLHLPEDSNESSVLQLFSPGADVGISDELLIKLLRLLKKYLMDDSVVIVDMTARAIRGILSTKKGQSALPSFDSFERSLIAVHSKGVNSQLVEKLLLDAKNKANDEAISFHDPALWKTHGKTYEKWLCPLAYSLINQTNDIVIRLCQDIVLLKTELAELLFPVILANLADKKDMSSDLCLFISHQVQENIFTESNDLMKSIQLMLDALNVLRVRYVTERGSTCSTSRRETMKQGRPSSYISRSRYASGTSKDLSPSSNTVITSSPLLEKVYWLSIDYLVVAKSAIHCGSYFTAVMYMEYWCEEKFSGLTLGNPDFSQFDMLPPHIELLVAAVTQINEPDSLYGIIQSHKLRSQVITYEHEGNWSKALEGYDLLIRTGAEQMGNLSDSLLRAHPKGANESMFPKPENELGNWKSYKGLMRSLQQTGCTHILDVYCHGLTTQKGQLQHDPEFSELQYEAAWRAGNWDFSLLSTDANSSYSRQHVKIGHFNESLHSCLRALQEGDSNEFHLKLIDSKQELVSSICHASKESTENIYLAIVRLQILDHLGMAWRLRWNSNLSENMKSNLAFQKLSSEPVIPSMSQGSRFSLAAANLHELKLLNASTETQEATSYICFLGRLEEAKLLRAQGQHEMAINLARYILLHYKLGNEASNAFRLVGKWLAETRSSNSRTILEKYLKHAVELTEQNKSTDKKFIARQCRTYFHLAHYTDALFRSYEERLASSEWQAAMRLRRHKTKELEVLIRRLKSSGKSEKIDYSAKIQELQKQLTMDKEEAEKLQDDRDNFLDLALEGYQHCLVIGDKYDLRVVFRLVSLWFSLSSRKNVINSMLRAVREVQSYKFIPLVYQIASRMGSSKDGQGSQTFQFAVVSLVKKMAIDHPYHTMFQLLALANGDRVKDKQRSRNSFIVDMDKKDAAENLLNELSSYHGPILRQMKQMVEIYIKLAELETKKEDTNKKITLPRDIRSLQELELVPVVTATFPVDHACQYPEGSFPYFKRLADSVTVMNGINAPKVVECFGSDGRKYRQLAKSGNDDLRQDAVMEQFFGLVNTFLQNHRDTWRRKLGIRTYKVVPFTPSAGVLEWVDRTIPLGEYLLGSQRNGGAHGRYGIGDWTFLKCREYMTNEKDKRKAFKEVYENFRPVMHYFFLERYLQPANWFERRLSYTKSVAVSSMVGYIVGLGDRHSMNILIDQATAEVVHIDLGVAFEQGLMLKTPERVPFRLTRDIIDGMGVTGVEGVFRRCCEETLSVMRTNKEALLTIIEVFIHDPLYKWALSPLKALQRQKETDDDLESSLEDSQDVYEGNKDAARALLRVKQKLDGYEEGEMRSVQGQVQQLIQDAIDAERLCQMFPGWGPWL